MTDFEIVDYPETEDSSPSTPSPPNPPWKTFNKLYIISIDDKPKFYEQTEEKAKEKMKEIITYLKTVNPDWEFFENQVSDRVIHLMKRNRYFLLSSEQIHRTVSIKEIRQIKFNF